MQNAKKPITTYFLACEFKPKTPMWSVLDPFAYDVTPAFIRGKLGIISYKPESYAVCAVKNDEEPLLGYIITITHPDTQVLLDKIKGYYGKDSFNTHNKILVSAHTEEKKRVRAWTYVLSDYVRSAYKQIEAVEYGIWDHKDDAQYKMLEWI